jgi:hypothetical protein
MRKFFSLFLTVIFFAAAVSLSAADKKDKSNISIKKIALKQSARALKTNTPKSTYFQEGFEGTFPPTGWTLEPGTGDDWQQGDGTSHGPGSVTEGVYAIYFDDYNYSSGTSASIITPAIDLSTAAVAQLSFDYWDGSGSDVVEVYASLDGVNFDLIYTTAASVDPWATQSVDITGYAGNATTYFKFVGTSVWGYSNPHIDNIIVADPPSNPILSLNYTGVNFGLAEIGSTTTTGDVFIISNTGAGTLTFNSVSGFEGTPFSTNFDASVELGPGAADTFAVDFTPTSAGDFEAALIFDSNGGLDTIVATGSAYDPASVYVESFEADFPPTDWTANILNGSYNWEQYAWSSSLDGDNVAKYNSYSASNGSSAELITPALDLTQNNNEWVGFYYAHPSSSYTDWLDVFITTDTNWVKVDSIVVQDYYWHFYKFSLADYVDDIDTNSTAFRVKFVANSKWGTYQYLDKVILPPVYVSSSTVDWCNLQWPPTMNIIQGNGIAAYSQVYVSGVTEGEGQGAGIECWAGISADSPDPSTWSAESWMPATYNSAGPTGSNDEYMIDTTLNLDEGIYYYAFRYRYEGGPYTYGGYSSTGGGFWDGINNVSGELTVDPLIVMDLPYTEGFENDFFPPVAWADTSGYWMSGSESHSGDKCARVSYSHSGEATLVSPEIMLPDTNIKISFWWKDDDISTSGVTVAGHDTTFFEVSSDGIDWVTMDTLSSAAHDTEYQFVEEDITTYAGNSFWFRFRDVTDASYSAYGTGVDDITIEAYQIGPGMPGNPNPADGEIDVSVETTVSWENPSGTFYNRLYGSTNFNDVLTMSDSAIVLDGQVDTTVYSFDVPDELPYSSPIYWRVVEFDENGGASEGPVWSFVTEDNPHPEPFDLEAYDGIGTIQLSWNYIPPVEPNSNVENFEGGVIPADWGNVDQDGDTYSWDVWDVFVHSGLYSACSFSWNSSVGALTPDNWLISPANDLGDTPELSFWAGGSDPNFAAEHFEVRISTVDQDPASFTDVIMDITIDSTGAGQFERFSVDLSAYANQTVYIAWVHNNVSDMYNLSIDDIKVTGIAGGKDVNFTFEDKGQIKLFKTAHTSNMLPLKKTNFESSDAFKERLDKFAVNHKTHIDMPKSLMNFNIYRNGVLVGTSDTTEYEDVNIPEFNQDYTYAVTALYDDGVESAPSNEATAHVVDPGEVIFYNDFEDGELPPYYTVINANADNYTWGAYEGAAESGEYSMSIRWNSSMAMDDWAYIGPIQMFGGEDYNLNFGFRAGSSAWTENMAVYLTDSIDSSKTIISTLFDSTGISNTEYAKNSSTFSVPADGQYFIAFYGYSEADMYRLSVDDILLTGNGVLVQDIDSSIVFFDDFEEGTAQWQLLGGWGLTTAQSFSPTHSFTESPNGNYPDNSVFIASMIYPLDFSEAKDATMSFMTKYEIEEGFDYMYIDIHYDGISGWREVTRFTGIEPDWIPIDIPLGGYVGKTGVKFRFRFVSDAGLNMDGMYIDDVVIRVSNEDNSAPLVLTRRPFMLQGTIGDFPVEATITDISGVAQAVLGWATGPNEEPNIVLPDSVNGDQYYFHIPAQEPGVSVGYGFVVADSVGNSDTVDVCHGPCYISGNYLFYDDGEVTYVTAFTNGQGAAMRMTIPENNKTTLVTGLIRNYTDSGRPNGDMLVHVWNDNGGQPGSDLIDPIPTTPGATIENPYRPTVVDLRDYNVELSNLQGDFWIGFTVPGTDSVWVTLGRDGLTDTRSFAFDGASVWTMSTREFQFRAITGAFEPVGVNDESGIPNKFELKQNYPNPFNPTTKIKYALPKDEFVTLKVYNSLGQEVTTLVNQNVSAGYHTINFDASNLASGMYIYRIKAGNYVSIKKMMLLK